MVELVWDVGRAGTATAPSGASTTVGEDASFSPDDLLAMAAAGCHMRTFLRLAGEAGVPVLSYAAAAQVEPGGAPAALHVRIRAYVVAPGSASEAQLADLLDRAARMSPVSQALGDRIRFQSDIRVLAGPCPA
jgi:organic hydroperoxide reductase OsmC/OhrA